MSSTISQLSPLDKKIFYLPRYLTLLGIFLISIFALDVFATYSGPDLTIVLFMHLIPTFILIVSLILAWRNDLYGAMIFNILAVITLFLFDPFVNIYPLFLFTVPLLVVGELFFYNWYKQSCLTKSLVEPGN